MTAFHNSGNDQVFLASERTLLAWVRTSLAVMGFGFVVARFSLYLSLISDQPQDSFHRWLSTGIGVLLVLLGVAATIVATVQHATFARSLPPEARPQRFWLSFALLFAVALALLGAILAVSLFTWTNGV